MESSDIIKLFINGGFQLDRKALDYLISNPSKVSDLITKLNSLERKPFTITLDLIKEIESEPFSVSVVKEFEEGRAPKSVQEVTKYFLTRYQKISQMLSNRMELVNLISINKITDNTKKFSLIGMVKEKEDDFITVEDFTGETKIFAGSAPDAIKQIVPDEVIGLVCENENGTLYIRSVVYPDIPLKKDPQATKENISCYFISDLNMDSEIYNEELHNLLIGKIRADENKKVIFFIGNISVRDEHVIKLISSLSDNSTKIISTQKTGNGSNMIRVKDPSIVDVSGVKIFVSGGDFLKKYVQENDQPTKVLLSLIRKRHLNPTFDNTKNIFDDDPYLLDAIPDIFVVGGFQKADETNYKGATILSTGNNSHPIFWKINLKTRASIKIDLV